MGWKDWASSGLLGTGQEKKKKKEEEVGDVCSVPRHVSAVCCSEASVAVLQFLAASFSPFRVSAVSFLGVIPFLKSQTEDFFPPLGNTEAKKILQKASTT